MAQRSGQRNAEALFASIGHYCRRERLLAPGRVIVAVSGGADSVCLLDVLRRLAPEFGLSLHVAHFHHGLRGEAADADARFVAGLADAWQLPYTIGASVVDVVAGQQRQSLEAAAHDRRWHFLSGVAERTGATAVATGHTRDDQAETVLLHLLRGSGLAGLAGLPARRDSVVRPLLAISHADAVGWCQAHDLAWHEDASNAKPWCARNQVRLEVLPVLRRYNPAIDATLARTAESLQADLRHLDEEAAVALAALRRPAVLGEDRLDLIGFRALPEALRRRALLHWLGEKTEASHIAAAEALLLTASVGAVIALPRRRQLLRDYHEAVLTAATPAAPLPAVLLNVPGRTEAPAWGWRVCARMLSAPVPRPPGRWTVDLGATAVQLPLVLRSRQPGDRIILPGVAGAKKLQDVFVDAKIPRRERDRIGVLAAANGVAWLVGHRAAAWAAATPESRTVLRIEVTPIVGGEDGC